MFDFVERLATYGSGERWLVHVDGAPRVLWLLRHHDPEWFARVQDAARPYLGPIHPRVSTLFSTATHGEGWLVLEVDDDRGPVLGDAAAQLVDPVERERWSVAQIAAIASGLAAVEGRAAGFAHGALDAESLFVDEGGHGRVRAPLPWAPSRPSTRAGGVDWHLVWCMSPETVRMQPPTPASTVFTLASLLYHALSGRWPFADENAMTVVMLVLQHPYAPIETQTAGLQSVFARAFAKDPAARIPDPGAHARELLACVPDAADYDAVVSDRIVSWRGGLRAATVDVERCRADWETLPASALANARRCTRCDHDVVRARSAVVPLSNLYCRPK